MLYHIAEVVEERTFAKGQWLFGQGDVIEGVHLIVEGQVRLTHIDRMGVKYQVSDEGPGYVSGEDALLMGDFHDYTVTALETVTTLFISRDTFKTVLDDHPHLRRNLKIDPEIQKRRVLQEFDWLRDGEWMIFAVRRHWVRFWRRVLPPLLLLLLMIPVIVALLISEHLIFRLAGGILLLPIIALLLLMAWIYLDWRNDLFALTTQRVVHFERIWPFKEFFAETPLDNIEDIYEVRPSLAANLLDYGSLLLQTAGETVHIDMDQVPNTHYLREVIFREIERSKAREMLRSFGAIRETLAKRLEIKLSDAETLGEPVPPSYESPSVASVPQLLIGGIREYFFPHSWVVSADGGTIIWRRFWFAGFMRHLRFLIPLLLLTVGGGAFILANLHQEYILWVLTAWLFLETVLLGMLIWFIEDWHNDFFELTPSRIILVMQKPLLLEESRKETTLDNIQNISFSVPSVPARLLDYGHVTLETAGPQGKFKLQWLRHPQKVQQAISKRQREFLQRQNQVESQQRQEEMLNWFSTYDTLRKQTQKT